MNPADFILSLDLTLASASFYLFAFAAGSTALFTLALFYHWIRYNPATVSTVLVMGVYSAGALMLLLSAWAIVIQL